MVGASHHVLAGSDWQLGRVCRREVRPPMIHLTFAGRWSLLSFLVVASACRSSTVGEFTDAQAYLAGRVLSATQQPVPGVRVVVQVPISPSCTGAAATLTMAPEPISGADGRFSTLLTLRGASGGAYCIVVTAQGGTNRRMSAQFREQEAGAADTVRIDIQVP